MGRTAKAFDASFASINCCQLKSENSLGGCFSPRNRVFIGPTASAGNGHRESVESSQVRSGGPSVPP